MLYILKSDYNRIVNRPNSIVSHCKYLNHGYKSLLEYYKNVDKYIGHLPLSVDTTKTLVEDDESDELADEGGIIYYNEANDTANREYNKYKRIHNSRAMKYWGKVIKDTEPSALKGGLNQHSILVLTQSGFFDKYRKLTKQDLKKTAHVLSDYAKNIYKPLDLHKYYVVFAKNVNGIALLSHDSKPNNLKYVRANHDDLFERECTSIKSTLRSKKNGQFNTSVLFTKAELPKYYKMVLNANNSSQNPVYKMFYKGLLKDSTTNASMIMKC